jgi:Ca2+-transporting ATPase
MGPAQRLALGQQVDAMAREGLRVLAVASGPTGPLIIDEPEEVQFDLLGLVGFLDPVRKDVPAALVEARQAGIAVAMITGDYPETALAIAKQAGIDSRAGVMTGAQLKALEPEALQRAVKTIRIFARIAPEQKLTLVEAFKAQGYVVAMTGDGVNDAPALQAAHIGIAMGLRGTDVAREAASLVLLDDSFPSIIGGVRLGRRIFANLRKALTYVVAIHVPIAGLALLPIIIGMPPLLYPMHIVLMEMVIDPVCALVFEGEPSDRDAMRHGPRVATDTLFGGQQLVLALCQGGVILLAVLGVYWISLDPDGASQARATAFTALIAANLILALTTAASSGVGLFDVHRLTFWGISLGAVAALALSFTVPAIASLFHFDAPSLAGLGLALVAGGIAGSVFAIIRRVHRLLGGPEKMA